MGNLSELNAETNWNEVQEVGEIGGYTVMPKGFYEAWVVSSELKPNSKGTGYFLKFIWEIIEGEFMGKKLVTPCVNVKNASKQAQDIGRGQWKRIYTAAGFVAEPDDTSEIHEKRMMIKVDVEPQTEINPKTGQPYNDKNVVVDWFPVGKQPKPTAGVVAATKAVKAAPVVSAPVAEEDDDTPPWGNV